MNNYTKIIIITLLAIACGQSTPTTNEQEEPLAKPVAKEVKKEKTKVVKKETPPPKKTEQVLKKTIAPTSKKVAAPIPKKKEVTVSKNATPARKGRLVYNAARPLKWSDFKGRAQPNFGHDAFTEAGISYNPVDYNNKFVVLEVISYFDQNRSWVKSGKQGAYLLKHEQKHFDLCETYRRKMMKQLDEAQPINPARFNEVVKKYFNLNFNAMTTAQRSYNAQTLHGELKNKQKVWNDKIEDDLKKLAAYKNMTIKLMLK